MELIAIAAVGRNRVIGHRGDLPWYLPEDFKRFKQVTTGCTLIMGRKTFESIGKPLPGRTSIILTRDPAAAALSPVRRGHGETAAPGTHVHWVESLDEALSLADTSRPVFVAGGAEIYRLAWDRLTELDLTEVDSEPEGDTFFPPVDPADWVEVSREPRAGFDFVRYRRR